MVEGKLSVSEAVRVLIDSHPHIRHSISEGLVNYSALSRKFSPELEKKLGKKVNEESTIVAIKRYAEELQKKEFSDKISELLSQSTITLQDEVSHALFNKNSRSSEVVDSMASKTEWGLGEIRIVVTGANRIFVVLKSNRLSELAGQLESDLIQLREQQTLISVSEPDEANMTYGVLNELTSALAKKGISIEVVSVPPDLHFLVDDEDSERAYRALKELIKQSKEVNNKKN